MTPYHVIVSVAAGAAVLATLVLFLRHDAQWNTAFDDPVRRVMLIGAVLWISVFLAVWSFLAAPVFGTRIPW